MFKCIRGTFLSCNNFEKEDNTIIRVYPYSVQLDRIRDKYPYKAFIRIDEDRIVYEIIEDS